MEYFDSYYEEQEKRSRSKGFWPGMLLGGLIALVLMIGLTAFFGMRFIKETGEQLEAYQASLEEAASFAAEKYADDSYAERFAEINAYLREYMVLDIDQEKMLENALKAYIASSGDPYSAYLTPAELEDMLSSSTGSYCGIGVRISQNMDTLVCTIIQVFSGSPALEAGLKAGDVFRAIEGEDVTQMESDNLVALVRGEEGSFVEVTVYRPSEDREISVKVERRRVQVDTVSYRMLNESVGYIQLDEFDEVSIQQVQQALNALKKEGMKSLVFDLRSNPGGLLNSVQSISDYFLEAGDLLLTMKDKQGQEYRFYSNNKPTFTGKLVVLVDGYSASASEVMTGALKDHGRATIMGGQTFGKGIVQSFFTLNDGSGLKLTTEYYYTPGGTCIHGVGITPDILLEDDPQTPDTDELLEAAVAELMK